MRSFFMSHTTKIIAFPLSHKYVVIANSWNEIELNVNNDREQTNKLLVIMQIFHYGSKMIFAVYFLLS